MLQINSRKVAEGQTPDSEAPNLPDPWSQFLYKTDSSGIEKEAGTPSAGDTPLMEVPAFGNVVEAAAEAMEEDDGTGDTQNSAVIDHPLKSDERAASPNELDNHVGERDMLNNSLNNMSTSMTRSTTSLGNKQHGGCLLLSDHDRIRQLIQEFAVRGLLPWAERTLRTLNDTVSHCTVLISLAIPHLLNDNN